MKVQKENKEELITFSWRDLGVTVLIFGICTVVCVFMMKIRRDDPVIPLLYGAAVFLTAFCTDGFLFGMAGSLLGLLMISFCFPHAYRPFSIGLAGYLLTGLSLFVIAFLTCCLNAKRKQAEAFRKEAERERLRANLLCAVSGELLPPLHSFTDTVSVLLENGEMFSEKQKRRLLQESRQDAERFTRMAEKLLALGRPDGDIALWKPLEAVEEVVGEAVQKLRSRFPETKIRVSVPEELLLVPMDAILIEQVIIRLLENSVLHGKKEGGIELRVQECGEAVEFRLRDNALGIPEERLSVCETIVMAHGGKLWAASRPEGGMEIVFTLPAAGADGT